MTDSAEAGSNKEPHEPSLEADSNEGTGNQRRWEETIVEGQRGEERQAREGKKKRIRKPVNFLELTACRHLKF